MFVWQRVLHTQPFTRISIRTSIHTSQTTQTSQAVPTTDVERFQVVSAADLEKGFAVGGFAWVGKKIDRVYKHAPITAIPAKEGELLQIAREGFTTTVNTAKKGDWKVTAPSGDQYFLSAQQLETLYEYRATKKQFFPKQFEVQALCITQPIQLMAPWGTIQFLRPGDYLIKGRCWGICPGDYLIKGRCWSIYGILKKDFLENYSSPSAHLSLAD